MNKLRILLNVIIVLSTSTIVGILTLDNLEDANNSVLIEIFLQVMHISLFIGAILNLIHFVKDRKYLFFFLTALPLVLFCIALIGMAYDFKFSNLSLIVFDFYLIFWFFFLLIREIDNLKAIKNLKVDD